MYLQLEAVFEREGARLPFDYSFALADPVIASPVRVTGSVFNKTGIVSLEFSAAYTLKTDCARCGAPIGKTVEEAFSHILITHSENEAQDLYIVVDDLHFDLDALVAEDLFLSMPPRYLCRPDCKGLCPLCGADLNAGDCGCKPAADPRWDALKALMNE